MILPDETLNQYIQIEDLVTSNSTTSSNQQKGADHNYTTTGKAGITLADRAVALLRHQHQHWPLLQKGASTLDSVVEREIDFDGFSMKLQFNPGRIVSSSAKVDPKSIAERKCFLCRTHLPPEQCGVAVDKYILLANPFPIFREHFTIPHFDHIPQRIISSMRDILSITKEMGSRYVLFYNGPRCGASAPDHLHFQAGNLGFMGMDNAWRSIVERHGSAVYLGDDGQIFSVDDTLRRFVVLQSADIEWVYSRFTTLYDAFESLNSEIHPDVNDLEEPMLNILTYHQKGLFRVVVFLRKKHRPAQFFREDDSRILFSPASVDFGGVCITPVEKDFLKITKDDITDMFNQLSVDKEILVRVAGALT